MTDVLPPTIYLTSHADGRLTVNGWRREIVVNAELFEELREGRSEWARVEGGKLVLCFSNGAAVYHVVSEAPHAVRCVIDTWMDGGGLVE